jgi:tetrahydromethanopterin S-methyltransferase subunit G
MGIPLKLGKTDSSSAAGRRSTRLAIAIPISISGKDASDRTFKENTRTIIINKQGAKVVTYHQLALGSEVVVENRALGRAAKATIVWLGDRKSPKDPQEVGAQLFEAQNIWGIDFAPEDWQEGPPIGEGGQRLEKLPAPGTAAAAPVAPPPAAQAATPAEEKETSATPPVAPEAFEERFRQLEQRLAKLEQQLENVLATIQQLPRTAAAGGGPRGQVDSGQIEAALGQSVQDFQKQAREESENAAIQLREVSRMEAERVSKLIGEQAQRASSALEAHQQDLQAQVEGLRGQIDKAFAEARDSGLRDVEGLLQRTAAGLVESAARDLEKRVGGTASRLIAELQAAAKTLVDDTRMQFEMTRQGVVDGLTQDAQQVAKDYPVQVRKQLQDFQDQRTHELEAHLQKALEKQRQAILKQIQLVGEDAANKAVTQLKTRCEQVAGEVAESLGKEGGPAATILKDWKEQAEEKLAAYSQLLDGSFQASVEALQDQAGRLSKTVLDRVQEDAENMLRELQARLDEAGRGLLQQSQKELEEKIREFTLKQLEESDAEFDKRSAENLELVIEQLKEKQEELVAEATEMFRNTLGQMLLGPQSAARKSEGSEAATHKKRR